MADKTITADQTIELTIDAASIKDREGNAASVEGAPVWASSDETVLSVEPAADGMSAVVTSHLVGEAVIMAEADADLGDGVVAINGSLSIEVTVGQAANITMTAGEPEDK